MSNKSTKNIPACLFVVCYLLITAANFSCLERKNGATGTYMLLKDCLADPAKSRFVPLAFFCDFENNPLSELVLEGFSNPQVRNDRITLAWGMGLSSDVLFTPSDRKINHITFRAKSHPGRGRKSWPFKVLLNDNLVLEERMKPGWEQFSFPVRSEQIVPAANRLSFIFNEETTKPENVSDQVERRPAAAFDYIWLSETALDHEIRYSYKKNYIFKTKGKRRQVFMEPIGSTYWFEQCIPKKAKLQFGIIIDAHRDSKPFELALLYINGDKIYQQDIKLTSELLIDKDLYEGYIAFPFSNPSNKKFGVRISGPENREYLGKAGLYLLNIVIPE